MATDRNLNFYEGAFGTRQLGKDSPMTTDSVFAIFSTTKVLTGTCIMQLVEEGKISLTDPAGKYVPEIDELQVLDGFNVDGQPRTRAPKRKITVNDLMLHASGLCYEFFSADDLKYRTAKNIPTIVSSTFDAIRTVLLHDPGESDGSSGCERGDFGATKGRPFALILRLCSCSSGRGTDR